MTSHPVFVQISGDFAAPFPKAWLLVCDWLARKGPEELESPFVTSSEPGGAPTLGLSAQVLAPDEGSAVRTASMALWEAIRGAGLVSTDALLDI